jgi:hypothetical protein
LTINGHIPGAFEGARVDRGGSLEEGRVGLAKNSLGNGAENGGLTKKVISQNTRRTGIVFENIKRISGVIVDGIDRGSQIERVEVGEALTIFSPCCDSDSELGAGSFISIISSGNGIITDNALQVIISDPQTILNII